jgi:hypothetical protein
MLGFDEERWEESTLTMSDKFCMSFGGGGAAVSSPLIIGSFKEILPSTGPKATSIEEEGSAAEP